MAYLLDIQIFMLALDINTCGMFHTWLNNPFYSNSPSTLGLDWNIEVPWTGSYAGVVILKFILNQVDNELSIKHRIKGDCPRVDTMTAQMYNY